MERNTETDFLIKAPATDAIRYTVKESAPAGTNNFVGPPSDASWKAWLDLVRRKCTAISLYQDITELTPIICEFSQPHSNFT